MARWLKMRGYFSLRILLVVLACVLMAAGMLMLSTSTSQLERNQLVASQMIQTEAQAEALVLASYDDEDTATTLQRNGVIDLLKRSSIAVDVEYLDVYGVDSESTITETPWAGAVAQKIAAHNSAAKPYSVVICLDDEALTFMEQTRESLFSNIPVVFMGVNDAAHAQRAFNAGYATGVVENYDVASMVQNAVNMRPDATRFLVVSDNTASGVSDLAGFQEAAAEYPSMTATVIDTSKISRSQLADQLGQAGNDTIVFYLDAADDSEGNSYSVDESAYFISNAASQPVFRAGFGGVGEGLLASGFTDYEADGQRAGEMAVMVLNGTSPAKIPLEYDSTDITVFDAKVMAEYGIPASKLPAEAVIMNQTGLSFDSVRPIFVPLMLIILGVACIFGFAILGYRRSLMDMREIVSQRNQLERRYYTDNLTDMPNMQWLTAFASAEGSSKVLSIIEVALVGLDEMAEMQGVEFVESVIKTVAQRLGELNKMFLVHPGGNVFIIGFERALISEGEFMTALDEVLSQPVDVDGEQVQVESRVVVLNREEGMSIQEMVAGAEIAVRQAEDSKVDQTVIFYDNDMRQAAEDKLEINSLLKEAIAKEDFVIMYQPQINLQTNDVTAYEALVRLKNNEYAPDQFIPIAEANGMIVDLGRIVAKKVIHQLATWRKRNKRLRPVSINYSVAQLKDEGYVDFLVQMLQKYDVSPSLLIVEISEAMFVGDMDKANLFMEKLKAAGIRLAIDDFGAGYTSISRVVSIPADMVKIDRTLTDKYLQSGSESVIENLVTLVTNAGKAIVMEGVETRDQLNLCKAVNCDVVQGHYYTEAMLPERAVQYKPTRSMA